MKKSIITLTILFTAFTAFSQSPDSLAFVQLQQKVGRLQTDLKNQKTDFSKKITDANQEIENLQTQIAEMQRATSLLADSLGIKITDTRTNAEQQIAEVDKSLGKTTLWTIIGIFFAVIVSGVVYLFLRRKQQSDKTDIIEKLNKAKTSIEESLVKEFSKQAEVMESLLETLRQTPQITATAGEPDHSLALKLADEITLMERNISLMDATTKGLKQLTRSIGKLKDNLAANGYEIPELLGKPYGKGLNVIITNNIQDENLEKGVELITKIVKPQVNFNDKMIQAAQIEVSVG